MVLVCLVLGSDAGQAVDAAVAKPVAGAFEGEDVGVVDDAVDHGGGDGLIAEHVAPAIWNWLTLLLSYLAFDLRLYVTGESA